MFTGVAPLISGMAWSQARFGGSELGTWKTVGNSANNDAMSSGS